MFAEVARPSAKTSLRVYADHRKFDLEELAFFVVPRSWNKEDGLDRRFEKLDDQDLRDAVIHADDEPGGLGFLHWDQAAGTWVLTNRGLRWVETFGGTPLLEAARAWKPKAPRRKPPKYETRASESSCNKKPPKKVVEAPGIDVASTQPDIVTWDVKCESPFVKDGEIGEFDVGHLDPTRFTVHVRLNVPLERIVLSFTQPGLDIEGPPDPGSYRQDE